jgi:hypothetical protein
MEKLGSHKKGFHCILYLIFLKNLSRNSNFHQNLTRITVASHEEQDTLMIISSSVLLRAGDVSGKFVEKVKTHI